MSPEAAYSKSNGEHYFGTPLVVIVLDLTQFTVHKSDDKKKKGNLFTHSLRIQPPLIRSRYYVRNTTANERWLYSQASLPTEHQGVHKNLFRNVGAFQDWIGIWKCWFFRRGENGGAWRKTFRSRVENQQQTKSTYDAGSGNRTQATLVEGEHFHHCAIPALTKMIVASMKGQEWTITTEGPFQRASTKCHLSVNQVLVKYQLKCMLFKRQPMPVNMSTPEW